MYECGVWGIANSIYNYHVTFAQGAGKIGRHLAGASSLRPTPGGGGGDQSEDEGEKSPPSPVRPAPCRGIILTLCHIKGGAEAADMLQINSLSGLIYLRTRG